jgi:tetratricopeptide (TPR) repeat protein
MMPSVRVHDRLATALILLATLALLVVALVWHRIPLYGVETDLLGDSIPAARGLRHGHITPGSFVLRGPGYPILLAGASWLAGGDEFLAARLLNTVAAGAVAASAYLLFRAFLGSLVGLAVVAALVTTPVFVSAAIEAGTDLPALALGLVATWLATRKGGWRTSAGVGLLAGFAYLTRYNMVFLAPAAIASLLMARAEPRRLMACVAGFALPVGGWALAHLAMTGHPPRDLNFVNLAYEVYGQGIGHDRFRVQAETEFHSYFDVLLHDPARSALHVVRNIATRWLVDAHELMPIWIGALAVPGMVITWWRRPGWPAVTVHVVLAYLVLTLIFYTPRYFIYLLPFYLSGTFGLLLRAQVAAVSDPTKSGGGLPRRVRLTGPLVAIALIVVSAVTSIGETRRVLADPPEETRVAGELLRGLGRRGQRVMARKPHVAFFAAMDYVAIPYAEAFTDFLTAARSSGADFLFISEMEVRQHPQLSVLADSGVSLPGLVPIAHRALGGSHHFALYRLVPVDATIPVIEDSLIGAIQRYAARRPGEAWPQTYLGGHLVTMHRYRESLGPLAEAARLRPEDPLVARFQAMAHLALGEHEAAAADCERALRLVGDGAWERGYLGEIRIAQGRYVEALEQLVRAMRLDPANPRYASLYQRALADSVRAVSPEPTP